MFISGFLKIASFFVVVFLSAGTIYYWQGWVFIFYMLAFIPVYLHVLKDKKDLLEERMRPGPGMKWWDYLYYAVFAPCYFAMMIVAPMDVGRFHWSVEMPAYVVIIGYILLTITIALILWAMYVNRYFSSVVRIQKDRGHKVIQEGPYAYVRHPGYIAILPLNIAIPLTLGSYATLYLAIPIAIATIIRTYLEDKTLQKELPGYKEYTKKVKYRLIPYIW